MENYPHDLGKQDIILSLNGTIHELPLRMVSPPKLLLQMFLLLWINAINGTRVGAIHESPVTEVMESKQLAHFRQIREK